MLGRFLKTHAVTPGDILDACTVVALATGVTLPLLSLYHPFLPFCLFLFGAGIALIILAGITYALRVVVNRLLPYLDAWDDLPLPVDKADNVYDITQRIEAAKKS